MSPFAAAAARDRSRQLRRGIGRHIDCKKLGNRRETSRETRRDRKRERDRERETERERKRPTQRERDREISGDS